VKSPPPGPARIRLPGKPGEWGLLIVVDEHVSIIIDVEEMRALVEKLEEGLGRPESSHG